MLNWITKRRRIDCVCAGIQHIPTSGQGDLPNTTKNRVVILQSFMFPDCSLNMSTPTKLHQVWGKAQIQWVNVPFLWNRTCQGTYKFCQQVKPITRQLSRATGRRISRKRHFSGSHSTTREKAYARQQHCNTNTLHYM